LARLLFEGIKLRGNIQDIIRKCEICQCNNLHNTALPIPGTQRWGSYPGEDWQLEFTHLPGGPASRLLLVPVDTLTGWVEAFLSSSEKAQEVIKVLISESIPRFRLSQTLQSDNGLAY
jgi:hypothetical protein